MSPQGPLLRPKRRRPLGGAVRLLFVATLKTTRSIDLGRARYLEICRAQIEGNVIDAVILGCTEIPLVLEPGDLPVPLIDTARCHVEALFTRAIDWK